MLDHIDEKNTALALQTAEAKLKAYSVRFNKADVDAFKTALKRMAEGNTYKYNSHIKADDMAIIHDHYKKLLDGMVNGYAKRSEEFKKNTNISEYVMAAHDYLFALTMDALGGPYMYADQYDPLQNMIHAAAKDINAVNPRETISANDTFKAQRRRDADELYENTVKGLIGAVEAKDCTSKAVGKLYAEYQALAKRQQNHGAIWRFFHRGENAARTELLEKMKTALNGKLPDDALNNLNMDPTEAVEHADYMASVSDINRIILRGILRPAEHFGYDKPGRLDEINANIKTAKIEDFFKTGYRPNYDDLEREYALIKPLHDAVLAKKVWANNTVENNRIKEILGKNVMRLQLAVMKYNKENGDATAAENLLAGLEGHYAAEDAEFDRINPDYRVPEIPDISKLNEIQIKEKIQIDIDEKTTAKSEKVAPPEISNPNKSLG